MSLKITKSEDNEEAELRFQISSLSTGGNPRGIGGDVVDHGVVEIHRRCRIHTLPSVDIDPRKP